MQAASTANVTVVSTPTALIAAVTRGDPHIEIRDHLDMTTVELGEYESVYLENPPSTVKSIRARLPPHVTGYQCLPWACGHF